MNARHWTFVVWGLLGSGVAVCVIAAILTRGRFPTLGTIVSRITASRTGQGLLVVGWMWLGWHAFAR
jgi:hypothetical protein